jgi:hypothetical protein
MAPDLKRALGAGGFAVLAGCCCGRKRMVWQPTEQRLSSNAAL